MKRRRSWVGARCRGAVLGVSRGAEGTAGGCGKAKLHRLKAPILQAPRRPDAVPMPHQQPRVLRAGGKVRPLLHIGKAPHMHPSQTAPVQPVPEGPLHKLPALSEQPLAPRASDPSPVSKYRSLGAALALLLATAPLRFAEVAAQLQLLAALEHRVAVIPLVPDPLLHAALGILGSGAVADAHQVLGRFVHRLGQALRVAAVARVRHHRDDGPGVQVHRLLVLVPKPRPPILELHYSRVRVVRVHPVAVAQRLLRRCRSAAVGFWTPVARSIPSRDC